MKKTKKVGVMGKYGARYGRRTKAIAKPLEEKAHAKHKCPRCEKISLKRIGTSIWKCTKCGHKLAGGAYQPVTDFGKTAAAAIQTGSGLAVEEEPIEEEESPEKVVEEADAAEEVVEAEPESVEAAEESVEAAEESVEAAEESVEAEPESVVVVDVEEAPKKEKKEGDE